MPYYKKPPIKSRTKSFKDLKQLALDGINKYWSRHKGNIGKGVDIDGEFYEVFIHSQQNKEGMAAPKIIYFTNSRNTTFNRSHNWEVSRELYYKVGYTYYGNWKEYSGFSDLYKNKGWHFRLDFEAGINFKETSAHEVGHEILLAYGGHSYSKAHKGTSHWSLIIQDPIPGTTYPRYGEIDLMKYADERKPRDHSKRVVGAQEDILGLIWLAKIKI